MRISPFANSGRIGILLSLCTLLCGAACGALPEQNSGFLLKVRFAEELEVWRLRITVITAGEIEHSGARFVPDVPRRLDPSGESLRLLFDGQQQDQSLQLRVDGFAQDVAHLLGSARQAVDLVVGEVNDVEMLLGEPAYCGDNIQQASVEDCDDGNQEDGDGCSRICLRE